MSIYREYFSSHHQELSTCHRLSPGHNCILSSKWNLGAVCKALGKRRTHSGLSKAGAIVCFDSISPRGTMEKGPRPLDHWYLYGCVAIFLGEAGWRLNIGLQAIRAFSHTLTQCIIHGFGISISSGWGLLVLGCRWLAFVMCGRGRRRRNELVRLFGVNQGRVKFGETKTRLTISCFMAAWSSFSRAALWSLCTISTRISFLVETTPFRSDRQMFVLLCYINCSAKSKVCNSFMQLHNAWVVSLYLYANMI